MTPEDLQGARDFSFRWLEASTWAVVAGILLEAPEIFHQFRTAIRNLVNESPKKWITVLSCVGWFLIVAGVGGEGYFETKVSSADRGIQALEHSLVDDLGRQARQALADSDTAITKSAEALGDSSEAKRKSGESKTEADLITKRLSEEVKRLSQLHAYLTPRSLTKNEMADLRDALSPLADPTIPVLVMGSWDSGLGIQVWNSLKDAGFTKAQLQEKEGLPYGMSMSTPIKHRYLAGQIAGILLHARIGPMMGVLEINENKTDETVYIVVGDIRTAPLPSLTPRPPK